MGPNTRHGHVVPRADGMRVKCGGPAICSTCATEKARLEINASVAGTSAEPGGNEDITPGIGPLGSIPNLGARARALIREKAKGVGVYDGSSMATLVQLCWDVVNIEREEATP